MLTLLLISLLGVFSLLIAFIFFIIFLISFIDLVLYWICSSWFFFLFLNSSKSLINFFIFWSLSFSLSFNFCIFSSTEDKISSRILLYCFISSFKMLVFSSNNFLLSKFSTFISIIFSLNSFNLTSIFFFISFCIWSVYPLHCFAEESTIWTNVLGKISKLFLISVIIFWGSSVSHLIFGNSWLTKLR